MDRAGAGIRPRPTPGPRSPSSTPSGWSGINEHLANCPDLQRVYVAREDDEIANPLIAKLEDVIGAAEQLEATCRTGRCPPSRSTPEDDATIFYTSGTTGKPKGALATQRNINSNIMAAACAGQRAFLRRGEPPPAPDPNAPQRSMLLSVPFFHATGCFAVLNPILFARRQAGDDAPLGPGARLRADRAREDHRRPAACRPSPGS